MTKQNFFKKYISIADDVDSIYDDDDDDCQPVLTSDDEDRNAVINAAMSSVNPSKILTY